MRYRVITTLGVSLCVWLYPLASASVELHDVSVYKRNGQYFINASSTLNAPADFVFEVLSDFRNFHRLAAGIADTRILKDDEELIGYTLIDSCVLFFCRQLERVERVYLTPDYRIRTAVIPEQSDFKVYDSNWLLSDNGNSTQVTFTATMDPEFWIPPLIDTWAIRRKLTYTAEQVGGRIEFLFANGYALTDLPDRRPQKPTSRD